MVEFADRSTLETGEPVPTPRAPSCVLDYTCDLPAWHRIPCLQAEVSGKHAKAHTFTDRPIMP